MARGKGKGPREHGRGSSQVEPEPAPPSSTPTLVAGVPLPLVLGGAGVVVGLLVAGWQLVAGAFPVWTDENIHLYVARRVSEGAVLYRDVDSARPPLVIWLAAGLIKLGIAPMAAARGLVAVVQLGTAAALFFGGRRLFGPAAALLAVALFLLSPEIGQRAPYTGIQLVSLGALGTLLLARLGHPAASGAVFGLALASGQHALLAGLCAAAAVLLRRRRDGLRFAAGFLASFAALFGLARLLGANRLWENLVARHLYHLGGGESAGKLAPLLLPWLAEQLPVFVLALAAVLMTVGTAQSPARPVDPGAGPPPEEQRRTLRLVALAVGLQFMALAVMSEAKFLYLVPIFPLLCLLAGVGGHALLLRLRGRGTAALAGAGAGLLLMTGLSWRWAQQRRQTADDRAYSFLPHRRGLQMARLQKLDLAGTIARDLGASLPPQGRLFGQPTITGAVATAGGRQIAGELADLHERWIREGRLSWGQVIARIEGDGVQAVITPRWTLTRDPTFSGYLSRCYDRPRIYPRAPGHDGGGLPDILVFPRRSLPRPCT